MKRSTRQRAIRKLRAANKLLLRVYAHIDTVYSWYASIGDICPGRLEAAQEKSLDAILQLTSVIDHLRTPEDWRL